MVRSLLNICKILRSEGLVKMNSINKWKYLSFVLMGIIAIPTGTSIIVPQANAINATHEMILNIINAIKTAVDNNLDAKVSTRATQTSVNDLQTTANAIKTKTDNLPSDPASNTVISNAQNAINSHTDSAIASIPAGASQSSIDAINTELDIVRCNAPIRSHVDLSNCDLTESDLSGANLENANLNGASLDNAYFNGANLAGVTSTGCTGIPYGTPAAGTLPTCS